jgi:indolepyruvate decarboxylase
MSNLPHKLDKFVLKPDEQISITRLIRRLNESLTDETIVIADIGDALFSASELVIRGRTEFVSPAYYTSMGFSVPAALGAQMARPDLRTVVLVGDGAFQMTGTELSSLIRNKADTIVIVLDNGGYGTERFLHPGTFDFNDVQPWAYHKLPEVYGGGRGYLVRTEGEFDAALRSAWADNSGISLIQVTLDKSDHSQALERLTEKLSKRV